MNQTSAVMVGGHPAIECRSRPTIMSGEVIEFATGFSEEGNGPFGTVFRSTGPFEISSSRDAVMVHRAELQSDEDVAKFLYALECARKEAGRLSRVGYGGNYKRSQPTSAGVKSG